MPEKQSQGPKAASFAHDTEGKEAFLAQHALFKNLTTDELRTLDRVTAPMHYPSGRILYRPGERGTLLFLLKTGRVQLYHLSTDGRKLVTTMLEGGACFGEMALIEPGTHQHFAETLAETRAYVIHTHDLAQLLTQHPSITQALLHIVGQRMAQLETQLLDATFKSTSARLATLLLQLAHHVEPHGLVVEGLSQEDLAERLGIYRETVSSALRDLKDAGAIELGRKLITIHHTLFLEQVASS